MNNEQRLFVAMSELVIAMTVLMQHLPDDFSPPDDVSALVLKALECAGEIAEEMAK